MVARDELAQKKDESFNGWIIFQITADFSLAIVKQTMRFFRYCWWFRTPKANHRLEGAKSP